MPQDEKWGNMQVIPRAEGQSEFLECLVFTDYIDYKMVP